MPIDISQLVVEYRSRGFDEVKRDAKKVEASSEIMKGAWRRMGEFATDSLKQLGQAAVDFAKESIDAASRVEEMQSKFNTVFRDLSGSVTAELQNFATEANRSVFALQEYAATFQDTFVPLGFARETAADMSVQLVKLAEDLGSFNDIDTETVVRDLQSALVGNTETLRKYGVVAQETQIKAKALEMGLWDGKGAIDAQAKSQTILQLALEGTTDAQGDAIKTSDSYANVSKGLDAAMMDLKVTIGESLLPTMTELKKSSTENITNMAAFIGVTDALSRASQANLITSSDLTKIRAKMVFTDFDAADAAAWLEEQIGFLSNTMDRYQSSAGLTADEVAGLTTEVEELSKGAENHAAWQELVNERTAWYEALANDAGDASSRWEAQQAGLTTALVESTVELDALGGMAGDYFLEALNAEQGTFDLEQELLKAASAAGADAFALLELGKATGDYSALQLEAALKTAATRQKIEELAKKIAEGLPVDQALADLAAFQSELDKIPRTITVNVDVNAPGVGGSLTLLEGGELAGHSGLDFIVPPGYPNDSFPMRVESGEHVRVTPANQVNSTVNQNFSINTTSLNLPMEQRAALQHANGGI